MKAYLHYCSRGYECFPPKFFNYSPVPVPCPDCGILSRLGTSEEIRDTRNDDNHASSGTYLDFLLDGATPQNGYRGIMGDKL